MTNRGDIVIDCFAGSGSTLLAAETVGRRRRAVEIDGPYCDLIIRRWREMTGQDAILESTGGTFAEVEEQRAGQDDPSPMAAHDRHRDLNDLEQEGRDERE